MLSLEWKKPSSVVLSLTPRRRLMRPEAFSGFSRERSLSRSP